MGDMVDDIGAGGDLTTVCGEAAAALMMFETRVEAELGADRHPSQRLPIAKQLLHQHRMHPAIARLVSTSFYCGSLQTDENCRLRYSRQTPPFFITAPSRLPASPIVFIDTPFVQSTIDRRMVEQQPRYHNPEEVDAIVTALSLLRRDPRVEETPTLAVLTPYREQARRLRNRINEERGALLAHISAFGVEGEAGNPVATVDSFQGSEADVVLVSLVRNNHHAGRRALGFLSDPRRMNVLLSRAKWKLVVVGSLEFLERRFQMGASQSEIEPMAFLRRMLETLAKLRSETDERGVPLAATVPLATLMGAA
jgi:superfamily I DNA and/or RNA helicase